MATRAYTQPIALFLLLAALALAPSQAGATAISSADASLFLAITDIVGGDWSDLSTTSDASVVDSNATFFGNAFATASGQTPPDADGWFQESHATATADLIGSAEALHSTRSLITLENISSINTLEVKFWTEFTASATASVNDPVIEDAYGRGRVSITSDLIGEIVSEEIIAQPLSGIADLPVDKNLVFSLVLGPGEGDEITSFVDALAETSSIPEPSTILLIGTGLVGLAGLSRKLTNHGGAP
jgi:hypothetical protein